MSLLAVSREKKTKESDGVHENSRRCCGGTRAGSTKSLGALTSETETQTGVTVRVFHFRFFIIIL